MKHRHILDKLSKMLVYMLGRRPDEFGLIPDEHGYVKIKDLLKALGEETGWRHIRKNHIREVIHAQRSARVEVEGNCIRAVDRSHLCLAVKVNSAPTLLFHAIRQRAHPKVVEHGLTAPATHKRIILASDADLAHRLGRRIDPAPIILTVNTRQALDKGVRIWRFGNQLFLADTLPLGCFNAPPLPKMRHAVKETSQPNPPQFEKTPGSFMLDADRLTPHTRPAMKNGRHRKNEWKQHRKRKHRHRTQA